MNSTQTAAALSATITDPKLSVAARSAAWEQLQKLKRTKRLTLSKFGLNQAELERISSELDPDRNRSILSRNRGRKPGPRRSQALRILATLPGERRKDRIQAIVDELHITPENAAYYVDRVAKA